MQHVQVVARLGVDRDRLLARVARHPPVLAQGTGEVHVVAVEHAVDARQPVVQVDPLQIVGDRPQLLLLALLGRAAARRSQGSGSNRST